MRLGPGISDTRTSFLVSFSSKMVIVVEKLKDLYVHTIVRKATNPKKENVVG